MREIMNKEKKLATFDSIKQLIIKFKLNLSSNLGFQKCFLSGANVFMFVRVVTRIVVQELCNIKT